MYKLFSLAFIFLFNSLLVRSEIAEEYSLVKDLKWDCMQFDSKLQNFIPYQIGSKSKSILFNLNLLKHQHLELKLQLPAQYFLWIDSAQVFSSDAEQTLYLSIDSLREYHQKSNIRISLYSANFDFRDIELHLVKKSINKKKARVDNLLLRQTSSTKRDIYVLFSIFSLAIFIFYRTSNYRLFSEYFSISSLLRLRQKFDLVIAKSPLSTTTLSFIFLYAFIASASLINYSLFSATNLADSVALTGLYMLGIKALILFFVLMIGKILIISLATDIFHLRKIKMLHFYTYLRHTLLVAIIVFLLSIFNGMSNGKLYDSSIYYIPFIVFVVWMGRLILMFLILNKVYAYRKLYLFSYLCGTELIPLLLFLKYFLK